VRIGGAAAVPDVLREFGVDPGEVLHEVGISPSLFDDPDNFVPFAAVGRLVATCVARTGCEHFGLLVGQRNRAATLGLVGFLMQQAPDVGTALSGLIRHLHLHDRGAVPTLAVEGDSVRLGYAIYQPRIAAADQIGDVAMATAVNILRHLCGPDWRAIEIQFAHIRPKDVGPFRRFFRAPLRFDAEQNAVIFSAEWLAKPVPGADPDLRRVLQKQVDDLEARDAGDFPHQLRRVLRTALLTRRASAEQVAAMFSIHSRTLHRRLRDHGTRFQQLADETRYEIARQMLGDSATGISDIAAALDYADASAFTRAFRRWSGTTPAQWRAQRRTASSAA
jgi:AraC-like DNA-binding protein